MVRWAVCGSQKFPCSGSILKSDDDSNQVTPLPNNVVFPKNMILNTWQAFSRENKQQNKGADQLANKRNREPESANIPGRLLFCLSLGRQPLQNPPYRLLFSSESLTPSRYLWPAAFAGSQMHGRELQGRESLLVPGFGAGA